METPTVTGNYVLIAEGGGWPELAIGPFDGIGNAEAYIAADKHRESWGSVSNEIRDLPVQSPEDDTLSMVEIDGHWHVTGDRLDEWGIQGWNDTNSDTLPASCQRYELRFPTSSEAEMFGRIVLGWSHGVMMHTQVPMNDLAW